MSERDELDILRYKIDMHLLFEKAKDKLYIQAGRLAELAGYYKEAGYLKDAICEMKRSSQITKNKDYEAMLIEWGEELGVPEKNCPYGCGHKFSQKLSDLCPECNRLITVCSSCNFPNRVFDPYCRWCGIKVSPSINPIKIINITPSWFYPASFEHLSPPPVITGDVVIVPVIEDGSLLALKVPNGDVAWKLENVFASDGHIKLSFCYPYLYIYSTKSVGRVMLGLETLKIESIYNDPASLNTYPSFPALNDKTHTFSFPVNTGLLSHDIWRTMGRMSKIDIKKDDSLYPVMVESELFAFSGKGRIYSFSSGRLNLCCAVPNCEVISPPVSPDSNWVYFESFFKSKRMINVWSPKTKAILSKTLPDTFCSSEDANFNNQPFLYKDGVLLISSQEPELYYVKVVEGNIDLREIKIDVSIEARKVLNIDYLFSLISGSYFISRVSDGFFYTSLEDTRDNDMEFFGSEMMSRPLVFNNRLILICRDGVRCYTF